MKNFKSTKRALLTSVLSMVLCFTMLLGTTFAWFTDSVTSKNNIITAGNLDIELYYQVEGQKDWTPVTSTTNIFTDSLWEPGHTEVVKFKIANEGTLALKSQLGINVAEETSSVNVENKEFKLSDYIMFGIVDGEQNFTRESAIAAVAGSATKLNVAYNASIDLAPSTEKIVTMVVYMPTTVGNEANAAKGAATPRINLGINLFATQATVETDSFGPDYDAGAPWTGGVNTAWYFDDPTATEFVLSSAEDLAGLAALVNGTATAPVTTLSTTEPTPAHDDFKGKTVKLDRDIDLRGIAWTPIGRIGTSSTDFTYAFKGTFDGQNHTISNLEVNAYGWAGVFGIAHKADINNLKVDGADILANRMAGAIVGQLYGSIDNCHVQNATIMVTPNAVGDSYDNGDKVGGIVGWIGDNGNNRTLTNCSAKTVEIGAYRDVGGIAGYVATTTTVSNNKADNIIITVDQESFNYGYKDANAGAIIGRRAGSTTEENNIEGEDIVISATLIKDGLTLKQDGVTGTTTLYLVPSDYEKSTVVVPEGVTNIGGYAFSYNSNVKEVILSSTVRDLGRGFDGSTVERVVLNEGLETISSRAFRSTTALKEVVISSTVKTIADNAFQKSGIKTITIPATVETIGETAFGSSLIETVIIEGNTSVQGYAFRGCTKLRTVFLNGDDVTFIPSTLNGRNSMWFCNGESNNPNTSNITFYVMNDTVAARVKTAMGAEANNTPVHVATTVTDTDELQAAIDAGQKTLVLSAGNYSISANSGVTLVGTGADTVIDIDGAIGNISITNATVTGATGISIKAGKTAVFENVVFDSKIGGASSSQYGSVSGDITFKGCTFEKMLHFDSTHGANILIENCTFGVMGTLKVGAGATSVVVKNTTFEVTTATSIWGEKGIVVYCPTTFTNCEFNNRVVLAGSNGLEVTFNSCTMNDGTPVYYTDNTDGIIRGGNVPNVIINN